MKSVEQWQLVLDRNPLADGQFVYAVRSTGIYCRPTCPSRRPRLDQVEFYPSPADAERAGYRSCRRCLPNGVNPQMRAVTAACEYLKQHQQRQVPLAELAEHVKLSPFHLQRIFKQYTGVSPRRYLASLRTKAVRNSLRQRSSVTESIYEAGYSSNSRFYESATRELGMTPSTWRKGGRGITVAYSLFSSPLGRVLVAATAKGVCFLAVGDHDERLVKELAAELPEAEILRNDQAIVSYKDTIYEYLAGATPNPELPLDVRATAFQSKVWALLRKIRPGETRTYSSLAAELGDVNLTRAVARACATNPVSLAIPCHRVVRTTGNLAGYRWGLDRKRRLLELESRESG